MSYLDKLGNQKVLPLFDNKISSFFGFIMNNGKPMYSC